MNELAYWLAIYRCDGIGPRRFALLCSQESSLSNCFNGTKPTADFLDWCQQQGVKQFTPDWVGVEKDLAFAQKPDCHIITIDDPAYPQQLKEIFAPPPMLFVQGQLSALSTLQLAMVGSRHPSTEGLENAFRFASELVHHGYTITSGMAIGIDGASHKGAISQEGTTIAVLGSSIDNIYPPQHRQLARKIVEKGALVCEFPLSTPPKPDHFPRRNRIISGLSVGVLVVECAVKSGSLITAGYALDQGREVFAIPGAIHNPLAKGCNQLIRQGAKCVESVAHVLEELPNKFKEVLSPQQPFHPYPLFKENESSTTSKLLAQIGEICTPIDLMVDKTGLTAAEVSSMLLELELQGRVASVPGGYIRTETGIKL